MEPDWPVCRKCFEPVKREGLLARLARFLGITWTKEGSSLLIKPLSVRVTQTFKIRDSRTGELREYHSLDEVPPDEREKMRQLLDTAKAEHREVHITVTNLPGGVKTYKSLEEMPPELRAIYGKTLRGRIDGQPGP